MFKALVITQKIPKHLYSTLNRQIISQSSNQILYSPKSSPEKQLHNNDQFYSPQSEIAKLKDYNEFLPIEVTQIEGKFKLFHQYQLQKGQENLNQIMIERKRQQIATLAHIKTNILGVLSICSEVEKQKIITKLLQFKQEVEALDIYIQSAQQRTQNSTEYQQKEEGNKKIQNLVIYFKNNLMSEEFYKLCYRQFVLLPVYLKEVVILQRQKLEQVSYKQILASFRSIEPNIEKQTSSQITQKNHTQSHRQQWQWIQLPKCVDCLLKLQFEVSGIDEKVLYLISQTQNQLKTQHKNNNNKNINNLYFCSTCTILQQHRNEASLQRKLSTENNYDHSESQKHAHCEDCKEKVDIWICMVCGSVGCGRYKNADAYKHFVKSGHIITIDLQTERVWNYVSDCFSHKLLKNLNQPKQNIKFPQIQNDQDQRVQNSKLQAAFWQYCSVFSEEMQRQRIFYSNIKNSEEEKFQMENQKLQKIIKELEKQSEQKLIQLKKTSKKKTKATKKLKDLEDKVSNQRQILKQQEECLNADFLQNFLENDEDILRKKKQLEMLDSQLNQLLNELSKS